MAHTALNELNYDELIVLLQKEKFNLYVLEILFNKIECLCQEELGLSHQETLDYHDHLLDRINTVKKEMESR
jgi:hypothetical protein